MKYVSMMAAQIQSHLWGVLVETLFLHLYHQAGEACTLSLPAMVLKQGGDGLQAIVVR